MLGLSVADGTEDLQLIESNIVRGTLDSLNLTLNPRTEIVEGMVNIQDAKNVEIGALVRVLKPGMMREIGHTFVGKESFPMLEYFSQVKEIRFGVSKAAGGLDPNALQSSSQAAIAATMAAANDRKEMMARIFAEGFKKVFKLISDLVMEHQDTPRMIKAQSGNYITVNPSTWNPDMGICINVALGFGMTEQKEKSLLLLAAQQKDTLMTFGPDNKIVTFGQYSQTLAKLAENAGFPDTGKFVNKLPVEYNPPPAPPKPSPEEILAQVEIQKIKADMARAQAELNLKASKQAQDEARAEKQMMIDAWLKLEEIKAKYNATLDPAVLQKVIDQDKMEHEAAQNTTAHAMKLVGDHLQRQHDIMQSAAQRAHEAQLQADAPTPGGTE